MPTSNIEKIKTKRKNLFLRVVKGHFATNHSHTNYYIDVAAQKSRLSEAKAVAQELASYYSYAPIIIDTILCLDGMEVVGTLLANELTKNSINNINSHQSVYVVTPETVGSQMMFRDNIVPMIKNKHILLLAVSVASGVTAQSAIEAVNYYGGNVVGISSIFATADKCGEYDVNSVFNPNDLDGYFNTNAHECPLCKEKKKIDALVNCHGYSKI